LSPSGPILQYDGEWSCGRFQGKGSLTLRNGCRYHGTFKNGKFYGHGTMLLSGGYQLEGKWNPTSVEGKCTFSLKLNEENLTGNCSNHVTNSKFTGNCSNNVITNSKQGSVAILPMLPVFNLNNI